MEEKVEKERIIYRYFPKYNYSALWKNNITTRFFSSWEKLGRRYIELPPEEGEFYDICIGTYCPEGCKFCYTNAKKEGIFFENICETWKKWAKTWYRRKIGGIEITNAPFQISIGSLGEATYHPMFIDFLKTVKETGVIPNYTTSGRILGYSGTDLELLKKRDNLLDATKKYCSAVAVSLGNNNLRNIAEQAIKNLIERDIYVTIHHIIDTPDSVDRFFKVRDNSIYSNARYHVLLPLVSQGRSTKEMNQETFDYLQKKLLDRKNAGESIKNISFGAKFIKFLEKDNKIGVNIFPEEAFSKNVLLKENKIIITPNSFNLKPIKIIELC